MKKEKIPLVLLPGLLSNELLWEHQIKHLNDIAEIHVICAVQDSAQKMVEAILAQASPQFALAGHSMGGWLCLELMRAAPSRIKKLCLLNTTVRMDSNEKRNRRKEMIIQVQNGQIEAISSTLTELFVFNPLVKSQVKKMFLEVGQEVFINQESAMMARTECASVLPNITCPTLVIHGAKDRVFSLEEAQEMVDRIPNATLAVVEDSGHMSPMEMPQAITSILRSWLTSS